MPKKKREEITVTCSCFNQDANDQAIAKVMAPKLCEQILAWKERQRKEAGENTSKGNE